jgi:hypothetical protein
MLQADDSQATASPLASTVRGKLRWQYKAHGRAYIFQCHPRLRGSNLEKWGVTKGDNFKLTVSRHC